MAVPYAEYDVAAAVPASNVLSDLSDSQSSTRESSSGSLSQSRDVDPSSPSPISPPGHALVEAQPLGRYSRYLAIFQDRVHGIWPVLSCGALLDRLKQDAADYESYAFASAVCAAVIAQLRLPEHKASPEILPNQDMATSGWFTKEAQRYRTLYDYRESDSLASLLTSFFLHIYFANGEKLRTSNLYLRECLALVHSLGVHRPEMYAQLRPDDKEIRLRIFWLVFISERTFCVQHCLPTVLTAISEWPSPDRDIAGCGKLTMSFHCLTKLFTFLDGDLLALSPAQVFEFQSDKSSVRDRVSVIHSRLRYSDPKDLDLDETQRVDIFVTRNWIRTIVWEYAIRNFPMSRQPDDHGLSMLLPASIASETLGLFVSVSNSSITAHGYGMELKVFRIADSLLDVMACNRIEYSTSSMALGSRDALCAMEQVLASVGGVDSVFLKSLRTRMAELQLPVPSESPRPLLHRIELLENLVDDDAEPVESAMALCQPQGTYTGSPAGMDFTTRAGTPEPGTRTWQNVI
ncbi:hypothetical protein G7046_g1265 [Stylonectria norvegica]|nr:hypothetical protein G7046_g1265 [Stylonectria norvegica]